MTKESTKSRHHSDNICDYVAPMNFRTAAYVSIVVNVVLAVVVLPVTVVLWRQLDSESATKACEATEAAGSQQVMKDELKRYCFKQDKELCLDIGYHVKVERNRTLCCGPLGHRISHVISEELPERLRSDASRARALKRVRRYITQLHSDPSAAHVRPAAHVGILPNGNLTGPDYDAPRVHWERSSELSFVSGGLVHGGDRLTVTVAGYYYVYTGLQFDVDPNTVQSQAIVAYIYRHVNGTKASRRKLMTSRESSCQRTRDGSRGPVSMYMAGIFLLREKDEVSVRTASQSLLNRSPSTTYMGIHMI